MKAIDFLAFQAEPKDPGARKLWIPSALAVLLCLCPLTYANAADPQPWVLRLGSRRLAFDPNGALTAWTARGNPITSLHKLPAGELRYKSKILTLDSPQVSRLHGNLAFTYQWPAEPGLRVVITHSFARLHGADVWTREFQIQSAARLADDLTVSLQPCVPRLPAATWLPLLNGTGAELGTNEAAEFRFAGALPARGVPMALPMITLPLSGDSRILVAADPYFSTLFGSSGIEWTYSAKAGLENGFEQRKIFVAELNGSIDATIKHFFQTALPDVVPGPAWLHDIAMVDFDYLSDEGRGWFRDIDALTSALRMSDRRKVFLCLHGWYDFLGRYCFDSRTRQLDRAWTAFSSYEVARKAPEFGMIGGEQVEVGFGNCTPAQMSLRAVHERLKYARSRGFRAGLYFADGVNAGEGLADFDAAKVLKWGGWQGPDSKGKSYFMNPLDPRVRAFFLDYTKALLAEFGPDIDALVWDETFHVQCGQLGTDAWPGYADRAMMRLVREITGLVEDYNRARHRQIAFLTSDCLGAFGDQFPGPYALVSHGTFQDSWCQPRAWSYGLFANYRNVLWSCCWWPVTKWSWIEFGVRQYGAPVAISNGWGNDKGFSELTPAQRARVLELFNWRKKQATRPRWLSALPSEPTFQPQAH